MSAIDHAIETLDAYKCVWIASIYSLDSLCSDANLACIVVEDIRKRTKLFQDVSEDAESFSKGRGNRTSFSFRKEF